MEDSARAPYVVPRYRAQGDTAFFHFLHGTVPGHQIDFMYCPEVPQGPLAQTHFGHLARLMKYMEPRQGAPYAFAVGNLSRDDVQHEPGHGGLAILFALRVAGVIDHAGRDMLPYSHGIVAVDRALDRATLTSTMIVLHRRFLERDGAADRRADFYRAYVRLMQEEPEAVEAFLHAAIQELDDVPQPRKSSLGFDFTAEESPRQRIAIVHDEDVSFGQLAHCAASIATALYRSDIKWTTITSGREIDIPGGTTVRLVPRSEAPPDGRVLKIELDDVPDEEDAMMTLLFGAKRRVAAAPRKRKGWREKRAELRSEPPPDGSFSSVDSQDRSDDFDVDVEVDDAAATIALPGLEPDREPGDAAAIAPPARSPSSPPRGQSPAGPGAHPAIPPPAGAFDPRRSSPAQGIAAPFDPRRSSPMSGVPAVTAGGFDPRRSSPMSGVPAVTAGGFDPRRSSPMSGVPAVTVGGFDPRRSSPVVGVPAAQPLHFDPRRSSPVGGVVAPAAVPPASMMGSPEPGRERQPPPVHSSAPPPWPEPIAAPASMPASSFRAGREQRERKGRWIIAAAAFAAIAVIVVVAVTAGIQMSEETSGSGGAGAEHPEATTTAIGASTSTPLSPASATATSTGTESGSRVPPPKNPPKGRRK